MNLNEEIKPNNIQCYDCSDDMNYKHYIACDGKCFWCWQCLESQHINEENKMTKGHHVNCNKHYDCDICNKTTIKEGDKYIYIDFTESFIFDKDINTNIKYNDKYYHYECFCKFLGEDYMKLICNKCKKYCKDINNMRNIYNKKYDLNDNRTYVCIECYDKTDIYKCHYNGHAGKYPILICCERDGEYKYANGCEVCIENDWISGYCNECR